MFLTLLVPAVKHQQHHASELSPIPHGISVGRMHGENKRKRLIHWVRRTALRIQEAGAKPSTTTSADVGIQLAHPFLVAPSPVLGPPSCGTVRRYNIYSHRRPFERSSAFALRQARLRRANLLSITNPTHPLLSRVDPRNGNIVSAPSSAALFDQGPKRPAEYVKPRQGLYPRCDIAEDSAGEVLAESDHLHSQIMSMLAPIEETDHQTEEEHSQTELRGTSFEDDIDWDIWTQDELPEETRKRERKARKIARKRDKIRGRDDQDKACSTLSFLEDRSDVAKKAQVERTVEWLDLHPNCRRGPSGEFLRPVSSG